VTCLAATLVLGGLRAFATTCCDEEARVPTCADDRAIRLAKGAHATITITVYDETDTLVDLTDHGVSFRVKLAVTDAVPLIAATVGDGITLLAQTGDTLGQAEIAIVPADTAAMDPGLYVYEVRVTEPAPGSEIHSVIRPSDLVLEAEV
jgi:hypothetical protein